VKPVALVGLALATALLAATLVQAASLRKRLDALPAPAAPAEGEAAAPAGPVPSPFELAELARRVDGAATKLDGKVDRETKELAASKERAARIGTRTGESLAALDKEAARLRDEIGEKAHDEEKVEALTKKIRTEQQKAMIKRFAAEQMRKEQAKLKAELGLTPEQEEAFDKVGEEMMDKVAEMGSSFMDGEMNMQGWQALQKESNEKMGAILNEEQMKKYTDYQARQWGGRRNNGGQQGDPE
jgi:hypothetical protein